MDASVVVVLAVVWLFVILNAYVVLTSYARLRELDARGVTLRTLVGEKRLLWSEVRAPAVARQYGASGHIVLPLSKVSFFRARRHYVIVAPAAEASRIIQGVGQYLEVKAEQALMQP
jgi:hypothetical protein